jgi:hypothetical protein
MSNSNTDEGEENEEDASVENDEDYLNKSIIISSLNLDSSEEKTENIKIINLGGSCEEEDGEDIDDSSSSSSSDDEAQHVEDFSLIDNLSILKSIDVDDFKPDNSTTVDYKKLSMDKLKALVLEKKLSENASKLKKHELIKLLEESK